MKESERFERWFMSSFLFSREPSSPLLSENKALRERFERICYVSRLILDNPKMSIKELREKIAMDLFVSMRIALDYIVYARIILNEYKKVTLHV